MRHTVNRRRCTRRYYPAAGSRARSSAGRETAPAETMANIRLYPPISRNPSLTEGRWCVNSIDPVPLWAGKYLKATNLLDALHLIENT